MAQRSLDRSDQVEPPGSGARSWWLTLIDLRRLAIVVLGILIAFSLESWWTGRSEGREARASLIALREDFRENSDRIDSVTVVLGRVQRASAALLLIAREEHITPSTDSLSSLVAAAFRLAAFQPVTSAYDNLIHARDLGLVRDHELRLALAAFTSQAEWLREVERWQNDQWVLVNQPFLNEWIEVSDLSDHWVDKKARAVLPHTRFETDWQAVLHERTFRNIVMQRMIAADDILRTQVVLRQQVERILVLLDRALDESRSN